LALDKANFTKEKLALNKMKFTKEWYDASLYNASFSANNGTMPVCTMISKFNNLNGHIGYRELERIWKLKTLKRSMKSGIIIEFRRKMERPNTFESLEGRIGLFLPCSESAKSRGIWEKEIGESGKSRGI